MCDGAPLCFSQVYEQDWLDPQFEGMPGPDTSVSMGRNWLLAMGDAAQAAGVTIMYCMPTPADYLQVPCSLPATHTPRTHSKQRMDSQRVVLCVLRQSTEVPAVAHIRVSDDYWTVLERRKPTWQIGINSMLASSLALNPTKDVFWSTSKNPNFTRPNNSTVGDYTDPNPGLEVLAAVLSSGQVAFGDELG